MFDNFFGPGGEPRGHSIENPNGTTDYFDERNEYKGQMNPNGAYGPASEYLGNSLFSLLKPKER